MTSAKISLAVATCCTLFLFMFVVLSSEGRQRIAVEIGVREPVTVQYGEQFQEAVRWQIGIVLGLLLVFLGSAVALALGLVAWRGRPLARMLATTGICLSLLDLTVAALLIWSIS